MRPRTEQEVVSDLALASLLAAATGLWLALRWWLS